MIKSISLLTRKDGMSHDQFVKHWFEIHGPLAWAVRARQRKEMGEHGDRDW